MFRGSKGFRSARHNDRIRIHNMDPLEKLPQDAIEAMVEAGDNDGIAMILLRLGWKMEYAFHQLQIFPLF